jgi:DNA helicase II / ATP-dependent DNA helicase PcrA
MINLDEDQQQVAVHRLGPSVVAGNPGCLAADAIVGISRGQRPGSRPYTIEEAYRKFNGLPCRRSIGRDLSMTSRIKSIEPGGVVAYREIEAIVDSGVQDCLIVTTRCGLELTCTRDHPFLTPSDLIDGKPAGQLSAGDEVLLLGNMLPKKGEGRTRYAKRRVVTLHVHHPAGTLRIREEKYRYWEVPRARLVLEASINGIPYSDYVAILKTRGDLPSIFSYLDPKLEVHHKDEDSLNDVPENLQLLSKKAHARLHGKDENFGIKYTRVGIVKSVSPAGPQRTYDIKMKGPHHNFEASGFLVHNSGKTRCLLERVRDLVEAGVDSWRILLVTFTRAACGEMIERLSGMGIEGCEVRTIHGLCYDRGPKMAPWLFDAMSHDEDGALPAAQRAQVDRLKKMKVIPEMIVDHEVLSTFMSRCKNTGPVPWRKDWFGLNDNGRELVRRIAESWLADKMPIDSQQALTMYQEIEALRWDMAKYSYDDVQSFVWHLLIGSPDLLAWWRSQWSVVIVDEAQDCSGIQHDLMRLAAGLPSRIYPTVGGSDRDQNLMLAGDLSQCLNPHTTMIQTKTRGRVLLRDIEAGDSVGSCQGGKQVFRTVQHAGATDKTEITKIKTASGRILEGSSDHLVFACMPHSNVRFYTYLMWRKDMGFRIGLTQGAKNAARHSVSVRALHEGADALWLLDCHETAADAALQELQLSLRYKVPTLPFKTVGRKLRLSEAGAAAIFKEFGCKGGPKILKLFHMLFAWPTYLPQSQVGKRIIITLTLGVKNNRPAELTCESQELAPQKIREAITACTGISVRDGRRGTARIRRRYPSGAEAHAAAEQIGDIVAGATKIRAVLRVSLSSAKGPCGEKMTAMPLANLVPGTWIWGDDGAPDEVVAKTGYRSEEPLELRDLDIDGTTNYFANGIAVHNSVYSWRTAEPGVILQFIDRDKAKLFKLPNNYRSTDKICTLGSAVVKGRPWHLAGQIRPRRAEGGEPIEFKTFESRMDEVKWIVDKAQELGLGETTVLARTAAVLHWISIWCTKNEVPYIKLCGGFILDGREARDLLNYLRVGAGLDVDGTALRAVMNVPKRFVGRPQYAAAEGSEETDLIDKILDKARLIKPQRLALRSLKELIIRLRIMGREGRGPAEMMKFVIDEIGYVEYLAEKFGLTKAEGSEGAFIVLEELMEFASEFDTVGELLAQVDLLRRMHEMHRQAQGQAGPSQGDVLTLSTIHGFKGKEARNVILADVVHGRFPGAKSKMDPELSQEETRLLYVSVTRAQDRLFVTRTKPGYLDPDSPFWRFLRNVTFDE